ncbi:MAG TPA: response regulator [bacterium]|nr:response regulator [bacterium]
MGKKVLVVDDNLNNLMLEGDLLEVAGFEVLQAENAAAGIALAFQELPEVIIMDVRLPDMRGSVAAKILRANPLTQAIPIVFVTASVMPEGREEIRDIADSGFIGKPIDTRSFAREIAAFIK